jgi:hypothetical protein
MSDRDRTRAQALHQVQRIAQLCDFINHPATDAALDHVPVTMPRAVGALGFDVGLWVGLGIVGLWAALDAFAERADPVPTKGCPLCNRGSCIAHRLAKYAPAEAASLSELDDLRHLYAHNFAGQADDHYLKRQRHVLRPGNRGLLSCGAPFDEGHVSLDLSHLRSYANAVQRVLQSV